MIEKKYKNLLNSVLGQVLGGQSKTVLCTYSSSRDIHGLLKSFLGGLDQGIRVLWNPSSPIQVPYHPFLDWIYEGIPPEDIQALEDLLERAEVYPLHRALFTSDFKGETAKRKEELIYEELDYERSQMKMGIFRLMDILYFKKPMILILEDVNHYPASTLEFLQTLVSMAKSRPLFLLFTLNERKVVSNPFAIQAWQDLYSQLQGELLTLSVATSLEDEPRAELSNFMGIREYNRLKNFICLQDCIYLETALNLRPVEVENDDQRDLVLSMAEVYFQAGDYSTALLLFRNLLKWEKRQNDLLLISLLYRKLGYVFFIRNNTGEARKWALQAMKLAQNSKDEEQVFYALFLLLIIDSREPFYSLEEWRKIFAQFISLGESHGFVNSLAYRLSKPDRLNPVDSEAESDEYILRAIGLAKKIGNELRLANAYHILGYHKLFVGKLDQVMPLYKKSEALRKRIGNPLELAYLNNGTGYFLHQCGDFKGAVPYLYRSLEYAQSAGDYHEMCMALCNISINFLYSLQYESAAFHLDKVIRLMEITGIATLSFHTNQEILLLYATAMFLAGNSARAYEKYSLISKTRQNFYPQAKTSSEQDEILIAAMFHALMKEHEGEVEAAVTLLEHEKQILLDHYHIITYRIPFFLMFYGDLLFRAGRVQDAKKEWEAGLEVARKHQFAFYEEVLIQRTEARELVFHNRPGAKKIDFDRILASARANMDLQKLHKVMDKIDFLNSFQQLLDHHKSEGALGAKALELINTTFPSDALIFSSRNQGPWQILYELYSPDLDWTMGTMAPDLNEVLCSRFRDQSVIYPSGDTLLDFLPFKSLVHIPVIVEGETRAHFILGSLQDALFGSTEDLQILDIAAAQLMRAIEKLQQDLELAEKTRMLEGVNLELKRLASTDTLTGLNNRGALLARLAEERERTERYKERTHQSFCLLFLDLDNFKYYNDSFGHKLGDALLKEFSQIVEKSVRAVDFAARYGGDEFVVILPETSANESLVVAKRIMKELRDQDGFRTLVRAFTGIETLIPGEKLLSCSIGVAEYPMAAGTTPEQLLHLADMALYEAKHGGKNGIKIYGAGEIQSS